MTSIEEGRVGVAAGTRIPPTCTWGDGRRDHLKKHQGRLLPWSSCAVPPLLDARRRGGCARRQRFKRRRRMTMVAPVRREQGSLGEGTRRNFCRFC